MAQAIEKARPDPRTVMAGLPSSLATILTIYDDFATWRQSRPTSLPAATIAEAERYLVDIRGLMFPAPRQIATKWLASLGVCCAGNLPADDVRMKLKIYADLLEQPEFVYSLDTLKAAARHFKWFPSFAELDEFLGNQGGEYRALDYRLKDIVRLPTTEEIAAAKAAEEAEKLAKMLATPSGRITHKWGHLFSRRCIFDWWRWKDDAVERHGEALVDAWHAEVAALDWTKPNGDIFEDFNPLAALKACERHFVAAQGAAKGAQERGE